MKIIGVRVSMKRLPRGKGCHPFPPTQSFFSLYLRLRLWDTAASVERRGFPPVIKQQQITCSAGASLDEKSHGAIGHGSSRPRSCPAPPRRDQPAKRLCWHREGGSDDARGQWYTKPSRQPPAQRYKPQRESRTPFATHTQLSVQDRPRRFPLLSYET